MAEDHAIRLPFTQTDLAHLLGLTSVHVNRVLQGFRHEQLITLERRRLTLLNVENLQTLSGVTPRYLQLGSTPAEVVIYLDRLESNDGSRETLSRSGS